VHLFLCQWTYITQISWSYSIFVFQMVNDVGEVIPDFLPISPFDKLQLHRNILLQVDSDGFWRWCITLRINTLLDFVHRPVFKNSKN
jgi:hypothetical protein